MNTNLHNWSFRPALLPGLAAIIGVLLLLLLGNWQLRRADEKQAIYEVYQQKATLDPVSLASLPGEGLGNEDLLWRKISLVGHYDESANYILDNQVMDGRPGYLVFTPFMPAGMDRGVLVNRGWVAAGAYRDETPSIGVTRGPLQLVAQIYPLSQPLFFNKDTAMEPMEYNVYRVQSISLESIGSKLGYNLVPFIVRLEPSSPSAYVMSWPGPGSGIATHLGYAFQWFALAAALVVVFLVTNITIHRKYEQSGD